MWTYLVADLRTNTILGELPLSAVRMSKRLNGSGQLQAELRLGDATAGVHNAYDLTRPARRVIYALRDARPWWGGIVWASEWDEETRTVHIGCADLWSYLDHRKVLEVLPAAPLATSYVAGLSKVYTQVDQNTIARGLVTLAQSHTGGDIGITVDTATSGILRDRTYHGHELVDVGQALRDLAGLVDGPDIHFDVSGPDSSGRPVRLMRTGTPKLGQQGSPHRWDLGGNLLSLRYAAGGGVMATRTYAQGDGLDRGTKIAVAEDTTLLTTGWPLLEADDIHPSVTVDTALQGHAGTLLAASRLPQVSIDMTVRADMRPTLGEYTVGDDARLVVPAGHLLLAAGLDLPVRVLSVEVDVDEAGGETVRLGCQSVQDAA